jgi:alpha-mannosidase
VGSLTTHTRPVTPEYLELRSGKFKTLILPQGLPFHQRHGGRMLDVLLIPPGETARSFILALSLDREHPAQTAWGLISPIVAIPVDRGPPHVGPSGWLAHLDAPNLMLTAFRPDGQRSAIIVRMLEVSGFAGAATLRVARNPTAAELLEPDGTTMMPLTIEGDAIHFDYAAHDLLEMRVEF